MWYGQHQSSVNYGPCNKNKNIIDASQFYSYLQEILFAEGVEFAVRDEHYDSDDDAWPNLALYSNTNSMHKY